MLYSVTLITVIWYYSKIKLGGQWKNPMASKLVFAIFYFFFFFFFKKCWHFKDYGKFFLFHLKPFFCSEDVQIFVFPFSSRFLSVRHCLWGWSKENLKVYDAINCLNKNLITHFVLYFEKEKSYDIKTLSIDKILNKKHFYERIMDKSAPKASPRPLFNFVK